MDEVLREFAPADLRHVFVATHDTEQSGGAHGIDDLERRDLAEVQVGRKTRGAVELGDIAIGRVVLHRRSDEVLQALLRAFTRRVPRGRELAVPLDLREEAELGDRDGLQGLLKRRELLRGLEGDTELEVREAVLPEGGEDLEGIAGEGFYEVRFVQEVAVERLGLHAGVAQRGLHLGVTLDDQRLMATIPGDEFRAGFFHELLELSERVAAADDERRTDLFKLLGEIFQGLVQPPVRCAAGLPMSFGLRVMDEHRDDRAAMLHRRLKRRIVGETKIKAKPDDGRGGHGVNLTTERQSANVRTE